MAFRLWYKKEIHMRIIDFPDNSILLKISEQVLGAQPSNPKGQRIIKEIALTAEEFEGFKSDLRDYGFIPIWAQLITVDGKCPYAPAPLGEPPRIVTAG